MKRYLTIILVLLSFLPISVFSQDLRGKVVSVADGDTITVLDSSKRQHKISLYGIDCPENRQSFGNQAKKAASKLAYGKTVDVNVLDVDRYGKVGLVFHNNVNINEEMIKQGYAWVYTKYCKIQICGNWESLEANARSARIGLWSDPKPPWEYRSELVKSRQSTLTSTSKGLKTKQTSGESEPPLKSKDEVKNHLMNNDAADLSTQTKKELFVFGARAMGLKTGVSDVKKVSSREDIDAIVKNGLNMNGHLCAEITNIRALKSAGTYEVTCVAYSGGSARKSYVLEALKGIAFEQ